MNWHRLAIVALAALALAGCRTRPEQRAVLDSYQEELRRYEGIIYDLEYDNQILCEENERLKKRLERVALDKPGRVDDAPRSRVFPGASKPGGTTRPDGTLPDDLDLKPPEIDTGPELPPRATPGSTNKPVTPESEPPVERTEPKPAVEPPKTRVEPPAETSAESLPDIDLPPADHKPAPPPAEADEPPPKVPSILKPSGIKKPASEILPAPRSTPKPKTPELLPAPADKKVSQLFIDPQHTHGVDLDQRAGDDGLRLVLEPRNAAGEFVPVVGRVSVALIDPARLGEASRVAYWEFDSASVAKQIRSTGQRNIPLEAPWPGPAPQHSQLKLFARFQTADGRTIEATRDVDVTLPGQVQQRWTPRSARRGADEESQR